MSKVLFFREWKSIFILVVLMWVPFKTVIYGQTTPSSPYANGTPIVIGTGTGEYNWTAASLYGGSSSGTLNSTELTISNTLSGDHARKIYGGSASGGITGKSKVVYNGNNNYDIKTILISNDPGIQIGHLYGANNSGTVNNSHIVINSGRVRYYVLGVSNGAGCTVGNTLIEINEALVGFPPTLPETNGQGEVYGGGMGAANKVTGDTRIIIKGNNYNASAYSAGDPVTLIRQHVVGGGSSSNVDGNTLVEILGGTIYGHVTGGGGGSGSVVGGNATVNISGGEIRTDGSGGNGGSVFGGGYSNGNPVNGNTAVNITENAFIQGSVYGGGRYKVLGASNVLGNATVTIENGQIGGDVYAGGQSGSTVAKVATVVLKDMGQTNTFATGFANKILRGGIATSGKANMIFDNYEAENKATIGASGTGAFDTLTFKNNSSLIIDPTSNYYSKSWVVETGSSVEFRANTNTSTTTGTFSNGGTLTLNTNDNLTLNLHGNYLSLENGKLVMSATSNTIKDFLQIDGMAKKDDGKSTSIQLSLTPGWDGGRIILVQAVNTGSESDAFVLGTTLPSIPGRNVGFYSEVSGDYRIWYIEATCDPVTATITGTTAGCSGKEYIFTSNGTRDNIDYVWTVTNGTIVWGQGTNEVGVTFTESGTVTVKYKSPAGCESNEATFDVVIDQVPQVSRFNVLGVCSGNVLQPMFPRSTPPAGTYFWTLDGTTIDINTYKVTDADNGKELRYNLSTANCGVASSQPFAIVVKSKPTIVEAIGLPDTLCLGSQVNATVTAVHNGTQPLTYQWVLNNVEIGNTDNLIYTPVLADHGRVVTVNVGNECGTATTQHTVVINGNQTTPANSSLAQKIDLPNGYFTRDVDAANTEQMQLPDKYWENQNYLFCTTDNVTYTDGGKVWFNRTSVNDQWTPSAVGAGYEFTVKIVTNNYSNSIHSFANRYNTTILIDEGTYELTGTWIPSNDNVAIVGYGDRSVKVFGLRNVVLVNKSSPLKLMNITGYYNNVVENVTIDGDGKTYSDYFLTIREEMSTGFTNDYLIVKDIRVRNAVSKASSNRAVVAFIAMNNRTSKIQKSYARIYNMTVESTCTTIGNSGYNGAVQVYGSSNVYFKNLNVDFVPSTPMENSIQVTIGSSLTAPSTNVIFDGLTMASDSILVQRLYNHDLAFTSDYRYVRYQIYPGFPALDIMKLFKTIPGYYANNCIVYDKNDGYWIIPSDASTTARLNALVAFYANYRANNGTLNGAPMPNIKLIADANGEINGFDVPDLGINDPVNIVALRNATDPVTQLSKVIFNPATKITFNVAAARKVNLYNIDFDQKGKYTLPTVQDSIANSKAGNFYNCVFSSYGNGELLKINLANPTFTFADASACAPDVIDLKDLVLSSGDTTKLELKYYDMNDVELQSTEISTPGTTSYKIVGTHPKGCSYTTTVNITIDTEIPVPVITGETLVYTGSEFKYTGDNASATNYYWEVTNGSIINGQGTNEAGISWGAPGTDVISLTYSQGACQGTGTLEVVITDAGGLNDTDFEIDNAVQCLVDNTYRFTNTTTITPPNELVGYLWDFGDGSTSTEVNPVHQYAKGGSYNVKLIAYGTIANDTVSKTVKILAPSVERPEDQMVCANSSTREVIFKGIADSYSWKNSTKIGLDDGSDPVSIRSFVAKNTTTQPLIDTITIIPMLNENSLVCSGDTVRFRITVNPVVVPTIAGRAEACAGTEETYTTEGGMSDYTWKINGGQVISGGGANDNSVTIRWNSSAGMVSVNYTGKSGCQSADPVVKTISLYEETLIISQPVSGQTLCAGETLNLSVEASGTNLAYQWYLNGKPVEGASDADYSLNNCNPAQGGQYQVKIAGACNSVLSNIATVNVGIPDIVVQKWENVLAVKCVPSENGGYEFVSFQWYKNGDLMQGETKSYLYVSGIIDYNAVYVVKLTTKNGSVFYTCGRTFIPKNNILVVASPNPVGKGQTLNVDISGITNNTAVDWLLTDYKGLILQRQPLKGNHTTITMPNVPGIYILRVNIATPQPESKYFKLIVN